MKLYKRKWICHLIMPEVNHRFGTSLNLKPNTQLRHPVTGLLEANRKLDTRVPKAILIILTPEVNVFLEKLTVAQSCSTFYGTRRSVTIFTRVRSRSLSWATWMQSSSSHPIFLRSILILSSRYRLLLTSSLFPSHTSLSNHRNVFMTQ